MVAYCFGDAAYLHLFGSLALAYIVEQGYAPSLLLINYKNESVYIGVPGDGGWTFEHDKGRQQVDETFGITSKKVQMQSV